MTDKSLLTHLKQALEAYHQPDVLEASPLADLVAVSVHRHPTFPQAMHAPVRGVAVRQLLNHAIEQLATTLPEAADVLHLRFRQTLPIKTIAEQIPLSASMVHQRLNRAIEALSAVILELEVGAQALQDDTTARLFANVPYGAAEAVVGIEALSTQVQSLLHQQWQTPGIPVVVTGLGGIGKSTILSSAVQAWVRREYPDIAIILWVQLDSAPYENHNSLHKATILDPLLNQLCIQLEVPLPTAPDLEARLRQTVQHLTAYRRRALLVIDNVETEMEGESVLTLIHWVTRTLPVAIGSRRALPTPDLALRHVAVTELSPHDATTLLFNEASRLGIEGFTAETATALFDLVGGHPLALKLLIAQCAYLPVTRIQAALRGTSSLADELYHPIYENAWQLLSPFAQTLLIGLAALPHHGIYWSGILHLAQRIQAYCPARILDDAIGELARLNLLQISHQHRRVYSLHRLTYRFIEQRTGTFWEDERDQD